MCYAFPAVLCRSNERLAAEVACSEAPQWPDKNDREERRGPAHTAAFIRLKGHTQYLLVRNTECSQDFVYKSSLIDTQITTFSLSNCSFKSITLNKRESTYENDYSYPKFPICVLRFTAY